MLHFPGFSINRCLSTVARPISPLITLHRMYDTTWLYEAIGLANFGRYHWVSVWNAEWDSEFRTVASQKDD
jgi:hypothetical protein